MHKDTQDAQDQKLHDDRIKAFGYLDSDNSLDLESISETIDGVKYKMLEATMGWRFNHPDRYDLNSRWDELLLLGKIVIVSVSIEGEPIGMKSQDGHDNL